MAACDSHLPGRCQHGRRSLPQAIKVRGGCLRHSGEWREVNFGHSQSPSAEHGLRSRRLRPCGALRGEGSGTETLRGTPENPSRMGTLACLRPEMDCPTHTTIWAQSQSADSRDTQNYSRQKRGLWKKGDLISRLISFARNFRPSMLICGKPKSEHGGL